MAIRVVARATEEDMGCPSATATAHIGVIASRAIAPEIIASAILRKSQFVAVAPDILDREIAHIATGVPLGRK